MTAPPRIGSLCSGYGGLDLAVRDVLGGSVVWHCENDPNAAAILAHHWPDVPNLGDLTAVDFGEVQPVDVLTAGFPCQDVSLAGHRAGIAEGTRSGLWQHVARAIASLRPSLVVIENVRGLLSTSAHSHVEPCPWCLGDARREPPLRALGAVLGDLAGIGFDAEWCGVRAAEIGAPHQRERLFVLAWPADPAGEGSQGARLRRRAAHGRGAAPDTSQTGRGTGPGFRTGEPPGLGWRRLGDQTRAATTHPEGQRWGEGQPEPETRGRESDAGERRGSDAADPAGQRLPEQQRDSGGAGSGRTSGEPDARDAVDWGSYRPAVERWEQLTRPAPRPTDDRDRLAPPFVEWLMGLPSGHVTGVPGLSRAAQLKALGNGVVPAQAAAALRLLLTRTDTPRPNDAEVTAP